MFGKLVPNLLVWLTFFCLTGCSLEEINDSAAPTSNQISAIENKIVEFQTNFQAAVMSFNRDAMLADFQKPDLADTKILTIAEGDYTPYEKDYQTLFDELQQVVADQAKWHLEHNYQLTLNLTALTFQIDSRDHGFGEDTFAVRESGDGYPEALTTDTGTITWEVQNITGEWKIVKMTIHYDASPRNANLVQNRKTRPGAFGFGAYVWKD